MKKILSLLIIFVILITACSSNPYDKYMRLGKDSLIDKEYKEAIEYFELALIEKPNDDDAQVLFDKSKALSIKEGKLVIFNDFINDTSTINQELKELSRNIQFKGNEKITKQEASSKLLGAEKLSKRIYELAGKWDIVDQYSSALHLLESSNNSLMNSLDIVINDDGTFNPDNYESVFDAVRENPFRYAVSSLDQCREYLLSYDKKINSIKSEIENEDHIQ